MSIGLKARTLRRIAVEGDGGVEKQIRLTVDLAEAGRYADAMQHRRMAKQLMELDLRCSPEDPLVLNDCAAAMAELDELGIAIDLLNRARARAPQNPDVLLNLAVILWWRGHYRDAGRLAAQASLLAPEDPEISHLLLRIRGTLSVYDSVPRLLDGFAPEVTGVGPSPTRPPGLTPLHVLRMSLPFKQTGYSFRSQEVLLGQTAIGLNPVAVTDPFFPDDLDCGIPATDEGMEEVEGIIYHRLASPSGRVAPPTDGSHRGEVFRDGLREPLDQYLAYFARELLGLASRIRPSLLHSHSNHRNALVADAVARALGIPHVYEVRGMWEESSVARGTLEPTSDRYLLERSMETRCCQDADAVVTLSQTMKNELVSRGVAADKIFLVPNAANPERFPVIEGRCERLARELGLGPAPVIGYAGSFSVYEGLSDLLRAFRRILDAMPEARALIIGGGRDAEAAHATAAELDLGDSVIFAGPVDRAELLDYYSLIDVFVVPRPPFRVCEIVTPLKAYEAMATGRAVVVSDVPALRELIVEGHTAVSYKAGCPESLATVCLELCRNPDRRRELAANGARWVRLHRSWEAVAAGYLDAYDFARKAF